MTTYEQAKARVDATPGLVRHSDYILADWPEGEEHWDWVVSAPVAEIVDWASWTENNDRINDLADQIGAGAYDEEDA